MVLRQKKAYSFKPWIHSLFFIVISLILVRSLLPTIARLILNDQLNSISPYFSLSVENIDMRILRGEYIFRGIKGMHKPSGQQFLMAQDMTANVYLSGRFIKTDLFFNQLEMVASIDTLKLQKREYQRIKKKLVKQAGNIQSDREFQLSNITLTFSELLLQENNKAISDINLEIKNLYAPIKNPITTYTLSASVFGPAPMRAAGNAYLRANAKGWDLNLIMRSFELKSLNPFIKKLNISFLQGEMDLYTEVQSLGGDVHGYIKPFVKDFNLSRSNKAAEHPGVGLRLVQALIDHLDEEKSSTKVKFSYEKSAGLQITPVKDQTLLPGIENIVGPRRLKQAQEDK